MKTRLIDFTQVYKPLPHQKDVHKCERFTKALMGGYGSGKTMMLAVEALRLSQVNSGRRGGFFAPTHSIAENVDLLAMEELLEAADVSYSYHGTKHILKIPAWNGEIDFYSCHDPNSLKGPTLAFGVCDEPGIYSKTAWEVIDTRVRDPKATLLQIVLGGTPEGMNWLYDLLVTDADENVFVRYASTKDNTNIPEHRIRSIYKRFPKRTAKMYLEGQFIPLSELQMYFAYDCNKHDDKKLVIQKKLPLHIGIDFNKGNMAAVVSQILGESVSTPLELTGFETKDLSETMVSELKGYFPWHLYPDAAGQYGRNISDFEIMCRVFDAQKLMKGKHYFMHYPAANGLIRDRTNAVNALMENAAGESHFKLNPDRCKMLRKDFIQVEQKDGSWEIDKKKDSDLTHFSDAFGYMAVRKFPIRQTWHFG